MRAVCSSGEEDALAQEVEAGPSEHLLFEHLEAVDVPFDRAGAVGLGEPVADGVDIAAGVAGE
ncbi:hypothetical protein VSR01_27855 [Actinacidiphila sp. DG2A-62]|uniref:hypothetical protein n=1 Tax=Actinacidiphila sp. DG2A-62 TaxID=3108821 RepID=UPI002DB56772|nr:hypothetical protein [Actinacidiphila sp. DG2A-62]MEC3997109.1 hypothetical protein [Actinacidiphila sp. DG2A-62]